MFKDLSDLFKKHINDPKKLDIILKKEYYSQEAYYSISHNEAIIDIYTWSLNNNNKKYIKYIIDASFRNIFNLKKHIIFYHALTYYNIYSIKLICKTSIKYNNLFSHNELYRMIIELILSYNKYPEIINIGKYIHQLGGEKNVNLI